MSRRIPLLLALLALLGLGAYFLLRPQPALVPAPPTGPNPVGERPEVGLPEGEWPIGTFLVLAIGPDTASAARFLERDAEARAFLGEAAIGPSYLYLVDRPSQNGPAHLLIPVRPDAQRQGPKEGRFADFQGHEGFYTDLSAPLANKKLVGRLDEAAERLRLAADDAGQRSEGPFLFEVSDGAVWRAWIDVSDTPVRP